MKIGILAAPQRNGAMRHETSRLVHEVHAANHDATVIDYTSLVIGSDENGSYRFIGNHDPMPSVHIVIPYCDTDVRAGERALHALRSYGIPLTVNPEAINTARDKFLAQMAFGQAGIRHPKSLALPAKLPFRLNSLMDKVEEDPNKEIVVKLNFGTLGDGVWRHNRRAAWLRSQWLTRLGQSFMFQQFIAPPPGEEITDRGVVVCDDQIITAFKRIAKPGEFRANLAKDGKGVEHTPSEAEAAMALHIGRVLNIPFYRVDTIGPKNDPYALELNVFPGMQIEEITGVNVAEKYVQHTIKQYQEFGPDLASRQ